MGVTRPKTGGASLRRAEQHSDNNVYIIQFETKRDNRRGMDAASDLGEVSQKKVGDQVVTVVDGRQLRELDELKVKYRHYVPPRSGDNQGYA